MFVIVVTLNFTHFNCSRYCSVRSTLHASGFVFGYNRRKTSRFEHRGEGGRGLGGSFTRLTPPLGFSCSSGRWIIVCFVETACIYFVRVKRWLHWFLSFAEYGKELLVMALGESFVCVTCLTLVTYVALNNIAVLKTTHDAKSAPQFLLLHFPVLSTHTHTHTHTHTPGGGGRGRECA